MLDLLLSSSSSPLPCFHASSCYARPIVPVILSLTSFKGRRQKYYVQHFTFSCATQYDWEVPLCFETPLDKPTKLTLALISRHGYQSLESTAVGRERMNCMRTLFRILISSAAIRTDHDKGTDRPRAALVSLRCCHLAPWHFFGAQNTPQHQQNIYKTSPI